jgi:hypothetical protein
MPAFNVVVFGGDHCGPEVRLLQETTPLFPSTQSFGRGTRVIDLLANSTRINRLPLRLSR